MKVWIVNPYGTLPSEGWREYRSSMLSRALSDYGHDVIWWISNFEHRSKLFRPSGFLKDEALPDSVHIYSVPSSSYIKNISFARIKYEIKFGRNFRKLANLMPAPDVIVLADPSLFYSSPVISYAHNVGAKIVLDVLDLWPEQFHVALPKALRPFGKFLFSLLYRRRQRVINVVDAVVGVTKDHLNAVNPPNDKHCVVAYLGLDYNKFLLDRLLDVSADIVSFLKNSDLVVVYAGTLGEAYDFETVLKAAEAVVLANSRIKFILAGDGPYSHSCLALARRFSKNILFLGKISAENLPSIYSLCHVGICSYSKDSTVTMPVKLYDYLAGGLFILYSINGEINEVLSSNFCGMQYLPEEPRELARAILALVDNEVVTGRMTGSSNLAMTYDQSFQHRKVAELVNLLKENYN
jgi:glycosyltransferase involved in cell wall biosynthesis